MSGQLIAHLQDLLGGTPWAGRVRFRAMFGGHGMYCDGRMCAIVIGDGLYLKTDADNRAEFLERGLAPFVYLKKGKPLPLSYYEAPAAALEDGAELAQWLDSAWRAAGRAAARKGMRKPARSKKPRR